MRPLVDTRVLRPTESALALKLVSEMDLLRLKAIARLHARAALLERDAPSRGLLRRAVDAAVAERCAAHVAGERGAASQEAGASGSVPGLIPCAAGTEKVPAAAEGAARGVVKGSAQAARASSSRLV